MHSQIFEIDNDSRIQPSGIEKYDRMRRDMENFSQSDLEDLLEDAFKADDIAILKRGIEERAATNNVMRPDQTVKRYRVKC